MVRSSCNALSLTGVFANSSEKSGGDDRGIWPHLRAILFHDLQAVCEPAIYLILSNRYHDIALREESHWALLRVATCVAPNFGYSALMLPRRFGYLIYFVTIIIS